MAWVNFYYRDVDNIGDTGSAISDILGWDMLTDDMHNWKNYLEYDIIFGGGMLVKRIRMWDILPHIKGKKIGWGIGNSNKYHKRYDYSKESFVSGFDLLGVRDFGIGLRYVPCPTCLLDVFDKEYEIKHDVVCYQNTLSLPVDLGIPTMGNEGKSISEVIEFIASGETVISTSYHGAYWGQLLSRKVAVIPFNSKFFSYKHQPVVTDTKNWSKDISKCQRVDDFLEECRGLNLDFKAEVCDLMGKEFD